MCKRAIILAGGLGTRLKPYTVSLPKPLVPIGEKPILEIIILQLKKYGFSHITLAVNHMANIIEAFFGNGEKWGITIDYSLEKKSLSTMGPLSLINDLPENFLVMNGDILTDIDFSNLYKYHIKNRKLMTISACLRSDKQEYGVLEADENDQLINFKEKPIIKNLVSMGIYIMRKEILDYIPKNEFFGFDHLMHKLLLIKKLPKIYSYEGEWFDIGRPDDYEKAYSQNENFLK